MNSRARAIGYTRISTVEQANGFGLDVQERAIRKWAKDAGAKLLDVLSDRGISGSNGIDTRPSFVEALRRYEDGEAQVLTVYKLDRLARDLVLQETMIARLQSKDVVVVSVTEPDVDSTDPTRKLIRQVLGAISEYERALIRARMSTGKAAKEQRGGYTGGRPPFGWRAVGRELVEDPEEP